MDKNTEILLNKIEAMDRRLSEDIKDYRTEVFGKIHLMESNLTNRINDINIDFISFKWKVIGSAGMFSFLVTVGLAVLFNK